MPGPPSLDLLKAVSLLPVFSFAWFAHPLAWFEGSSVPLYVALLCVVALPGEP